MTFLSPGLRFFHQGEFEGRHKRISPHLVRAPSESTDAALFEFYGRLLAVLRHSAVRDGIWQLIECRPAWDGNWTHDSFIAFAWEKSPVDRLIVVVNFSDHQSQTKLRLSFEALSDKTYRFQDLLSNANYDWPGSELAANGLFIDLPAWGTNVFSMTKLP